MGGERDHEKNMCACNFLNNAREKFYLFSHPLPTVFNCTCIIGK